MQKCGGTAITGSLQQPRLTKAPSFTLRGFNLSGLPCQLKLKPVQHSYAEGSALLSRATSSVTPPVTAVDGKYMFGLGF